MTTTKPQRRPKSNPAPLSLAGHLRMLARCKKSPALVSEMCKAAGRKKNTGMLFIASWMVRLEMAHIHSWERGPARGLLLPRLKFGPGQSAPYPGKPGRQFGCSLRGRPSNTLITLKHMLQALEEGATAKQIVEVTGSFPRFVSKMLKLGCELGLFRIESWERRQRIGGPPTPTYCIRRNGEADAPRPEPLPSSVLLTKYRQRRAARQRMGLMAPSNDPLGKAAA